MAAEFKIKAWDAPYNIAKVIFALKNNNKFPSKIFAPSGSVLDIKRETLFEILRPGHASGALASRFIVLQMENSFFGKEDRGASITVPP